MKAARITINNSYGRMSRFVNELPRRFDAEGTLVFKGRNTIKLYEVCGETLTVKKYKDYNFLQRVAYTFFKPSKAVRAYRYASLLNAKGIRTPREVACIEMRRGFLCVTGYFVSAFCDDPSVKTLLESGDGCDGNADRQITPRKMSLLKSVGEFIADMHAKGVLHGDLNISNILCGRGIGGGYELSVIDTDRAVFKTPSVDECMEDLKRVTHHREVLVCIIRAYAAKRGWNAEETIAETLQKLNAFEKKNLLKRKLKGIVGKEKHTNS